MSVIYPITSLTILASSTESSEIPSIALENAVMLPPKLSIMAPNVSMSLSPIILPSHPPLLGILLATSISGVMTSITVFVLSTVLSGISLMESAKDLNAVPKEVSLSSQPSELPVRLLRRPLIPSRTDEALNATITLAIDVAASTALLSTPARESVNALMFSPIAGSPSVTPIPTPLIRLPTN